VEVNRKDYVYLAILDSASPFLTAPNDVLEYSKETMYDDTDEQYGEAVGTMMWRSVQSVSVCDYQQTEYTFRDVIVGVPSSNVVDEAGGIYFGLLAQDEYRPTVLQQLGYCSFSLDYQEAMLTLSTTSMIANDESRAMELFDFSPFGSNVHHYGVLCDDFELQLSSGTTLRVPCSSLKRPVVVVLDSGLTGCVLNDFLWSELCTLHSTLDLNDVAGARLNLPKASLTSDSKYWVVSSFLLPWFDLDGKNYPHVIAAGNTFLSQSKLTVDSKARRIMLNA